MYSSHCFPAYRKQLSTGWQCEFFTVWVLLWWLSELQWSSVIKKTIHVDQVEVCNSGEQYRTYYRFPKWICIEYDHRIHLYGQQHFQNHFFIHAAHERWWGMIQNQSRHHKTRWSIWNTFEEYSVALICQKLQLFFHRELVFGLPFRQILIFFQSDKKSD